MSPKPLSSWRKGTKLFGRTQALRGANKKNCATHSKQRKGQLSITPGQSWHEASQSALLQTAAVSRLGAHENDWLRSSDIY